MKHLWMVYFLDFLMSLFYGTHNSFREAITFVLMFGHMLLSMEPRTSCSQGIFLPTWIRKGKTLPWSSKNTDFFLLTLQQPCLNHGGWFRFGSDLDPAVWGWVSELLYSVLNSTVTYDRELHSREATSGNITIFANRFSFPLQVIKIFFFKGSWEATKFSLLFPLLCFSVFDVNCPFLLPHY